MYGSRVATELEEFSRSMVAAWGQEAQQQHRQLEETEQRWAQQHEHLQFQESQQRWAQWGHQPYPWPEPLWPQTSASSSSHLMGDTGAPLSYMQQQLDHANNRIQGLETVRTLCDSPL